MKPNFLIIGAQKCGTTSLFSHLVQHPSVYLPTEKEIHFFDLQYDKGVKWYISLFYEADSTRFQSFGEASPYYLFHPLVAERVASHFPEIKLIVLLRDPVDRAYSHFLHSKRFGLDTVESFEEALAIEPLRITEDFEKLKKGEILHSDSVRNYSYASRGLYFQQVSRWLNYFPTDQFLFIKSEEFYTNPAGIFRDVCRFLGVSVPSGIDFRPSNIPDYQPNSYPPVSSEIKQRLKPFFSADMSALSALIGKQFYWE